MHGYAELVEALVLTMLTGAHARSRVADTGAGDDLEVMVQPPMDAAPVHDTRVGRAREALWVAGRDRSSGAVIRPALGHDAREVTRLPTDTTSLQVYGAYARDADEQGPLVTSGDRCDHRPDLTPRLCGLTVTQHGRSCRS